MIADHSCRIRLGQPCLHFFFRLIQASPGFSTSLFKWNRDVPCSWIVRTVCSRCSTGSLEVLPNGISSSIVDLSCILLSSWSAGAWCLIRGASHLYEEGIRYFERYKLIIIIVTPTNPPGQRHKFQVLVVYETLLFLTRSTYKHTRGFIPFFTESLTSEHFLPNHWVPSSCLMRNTMRLGSTLGLTESTT